jgi:murein DD-endopeptidase MepM/ murein hydrolase activator NlpD
MMMDTLAYLNRFSQTALNWFIPLADGTLKGCTILAILFLFLKLRWRLRPQIRHLILFIGMVSILLIPLVTQGINVLSKIQPEYPMTARNSLSQTSGSSINPQLIMSDPLIQLPQISSTSKLRIQLPHWSLWLLLLWIAGVLITSGKWLVENGRVYWQIRAASPVQDPEWTGLLDDLKATTGIIRSVQIRFSSTVSFPLVFGWLRPVILLPDSAKDWPVERRRAILLHELSHIRRYDNLSQIIATVAAIVYWFNPLAWIALRRLKTDRELACDDRVLGTGVLPSAYAGHLLAVIQNLRKSSLKLKSMTAMAAPNLEQRMVNILTKHDQNRKSLTKYNLIGLVLTALLIVAVCSLGSVIGFAADNLPTEAPDNYIQNPQVVTQGTQVELKINGTPLRGSAEEFPTLWPEQGVKHRITSLFGRRMHPVLKEYRFHSGIDIASPMGTPIVATADGEVIIADLNGNYGNYIAIKHKYLTSTYSMLDQILVHPGDYVRRGDLIAYSGASGLCTGPHLHYEIRSGETFIDPWVLAGTSQ